MLSVLIPIYNWDVVNLATTISKQCKALGINYEVICYDDSSGEVYKTKNRALDAEIGISYLELSENLGRAKIRNWMAKNARFENLVFLDCDSEIISSDFVKNYLEYIEDIDVIYGGRNYAELPPKEKEKKLHWWYGVKRESLGLSSRKKRPYRSFQTNNFSCKRAIVLEHPFAEELTTYGYEDLLFAQTLENNGIAISHIDNPIIHKGVENTKDFLHKSALAAENLAVLYHSDLLSNTKMVDFHEKIKNIGFNSFFLNQIRRRKDRIHKNLLSQNPNLFYFDMYRYDIFVNKLNSLSTSSS